MGKTGWTRGVCSKEALARSQTNPFDRKKRTGHEKTAHGFNPMGGFRGIILIRRRLYPVWPSQNRSHRAALAVVPKVRPTCD